MIDEQRANPFSRDEQKGEELLNQSLAYERAKTHIEEAAQMVMRKRREHLESIAVSGEAYDPAFDVALNGLRGLQHEFGANADKLWAQMEEVTPKFGPGLERLANAVLAAAANDYEAALCDGGTKETLSEIYMIEKFAECGAEAYTTLNFMDVLDRIKLVYRKEWLPLAEKVWRELRDERKPMYRHKCPLCGGGLYYVHSRGQSDLLRCTSCSLFYRVKEKKGDAKRDK